MNAEQPAQRPRMRDGTVGHRTTRRQFITLGVGVGLASMAGCLGLFEEEEPPTTEGDDSDPFEVEASALLLDEAAVEDEFGASVSAIDGLEDPPLLFQEADAIRTFPLDEIEAISGDPIHVRSGVWLYDTVDEATDGYSGHPYRFGGFTEEATIAVNSVVGFTERDDDADFGHRYAVAYLLFRDANAVGLVTYRNHDLEDGSIAGVTQRLSYEKHTAWRDG